MANILLLLGDKPASDSDGYHTFQGLQQLARDSYTLARYRDVVFFMTAGQVTIEVDGVPLSAYDLIYIRDFHGYEPERNTIADFCQRQGIRFVNRDTATSQKISKLAQYLAFGLADIAIPRSVYAHSSRLVAAAESKLDYPMIVKSIVAKSGNDNHYIASRAEFAALLANRPDVKFIAQEAIPNTGDYRVIVLGDQVSCVYKRVAQAGDHRNNVSQGGDKQYLDLDTVAPAISQLAVAAAQTVERDICGVDVMVDERSGDPVVLEANFNFGIRAVPGVISDELYGLADYLHQRASA